ncbi:hypothetical protein E2C01_084918 [Portunus trituberculatus]|uniref:HTH psq-type domain-containing protein n=1 Tax=Portunus trituberculatus TaxID=210409 RepID=A0A5B7J634_PORTR|nr:hypothetical protein [Portunus trituberculatus]
MPSKRPAMSPSIAKTRKSLTLEVKLDIIHRHERGEKTNSIAHHHLDSIYCLLFSSQQTLLRRLVRPYLPCKLKEPPELVTLQWIKWKALWKCGT